MHKCVSTHCARALRSLLPHEESLFVIKPFVQTLHSTELNGGDSQRRKTPTVLYHIYNSIEILGVNKKDAF